MLVSGANIKVLAERREYMNDKELRTFNGTPLEELIKNLPCIDEKLNNKNIEIFEKKDIHLGSENRHTCVLCKSKTSIDNSISNRGNKLICVPCVYKYFEGDYDAVFHWNRGSN